MYFEIFGEWSYLFYFILKERNQETNSYEKSSKWDINYDDVSP